ncbi:hypothetical protein [Actinomadura formosensis]|uniref:hypothetical protein n=1 Tax=Actinomadura formosensis TaxID=60706 RepID=UPI003D924A3A
MLLIVGLAMFAGGIAVGCAPLRSHGVGCGSAVRGTSEAEVSDFRHAMERDQRGLGLPGGSLTAASEGCDSLRRVVRYPAVVLLLGGTGLAVGGLWVGYQRETGMERAVTVLGRPWPLRGRGGKPAE